MSWFSSKSSKSYPDYWNTYQESFKEVRYSDLNEVNFVVFDTETTGLDFNSDRILSIGAVRVKGKEIEVKNSFEIYLQQDLYKAKSAEIHGLISNEKTITLSEEEAIQSFLRYIGNAVLVAHHADFDATIISRAMERMGLPPLMNKVIDTVRLYKSTRIKSNLIDPNKGLSLDEISEKLGIDVYDRHTAAGDAMITAFIFLKTMSILNKTKPLHLEKLLKI